MNTGDPCPQNPVNVTETLQSGCTLNSLGEVSVGRCIGMPCDNPPDTTPTCCGVVNDTREEIICGVNSYMFSNPTECGCVDCDTIRTATVLIQGQIWLRVGADVVPSSDPISFTIGGFPIVSEPFSFSAEISRPASLIALVFVPQPPGGYAPQVVSVHLVNGITDYYVEVTLEQDVEFPDIPTTSTTTVTPDTPPTPPSLPGGV